MTKTNDKEFEHLIFIDAGAGSGKTYRLTEIVKHVLVNEGADPARIMGVTFTRKAANELQLRVRQSLIKDGYRLLAERVDESLFGTIHSIYERMLLRFAFEIGISPKLSVLSPAESIALLKEQLSHSLETKHVRQLNELRRKLDCPEEWTTDIHKIVEHARQNNITPLELEKMGKRSAESLLSYFPSALDQDLDQQLAIKVSDAIRSFRRNADGTQKTSIFKSLLDRAQSDLRHKSCKWPLWIELSTATPAKVSENSASMELNQTALQYDRHPRFQKDIRLYIEGVINAAALVLAKFQERKRLLGVVDYADMIYLVYCNIDNPAIADHLSQSLDLLVVDEFQDTSPVQLSLFMRLAKFAKQVVFVGDIKQSIYGFQGADSWLVDKTREELLLHGATADVLSKNYRSRPSLVRWVNENYEAALNLEKNRIALNPTRDEMKGQTALMGWNLLGRNMGLRYQMLASELASLVGSGTQVMDQNTRKVRNATWGDVAILARTNEHVTQIAQKLHDASIPLNITMPGLLETPEVSLVMACLRRIIDSADTLATAEIVSLSDCTDPVDWLSDRLKWLKAGKPSEKWRETDHRVVRRLAEIREARSFSSPVEIVATVINDLQIREITTSWGPDAFQAARRQANLSTFIDLTIEYEQHCETHHEAATLTGLFRWVNDLDQQDERIQQPQLEPGNAVDVLTFHKAKGLEWPIVVLVDVEGRYRFPFSGVFVEPVGVFDVHDPLKHRVIKYWPAIFGKRSTNINVIETFKRSGEGKKREEREYGNMRLLSYVCVTRARDLLILAFTANKPEEKLSWLHNRIQDLFLPYPGPYAKKETFAKELPDGTAIECLWRDIETITSTGCLETIYEPRWFPNQD